MKLFQILVAFSAVHVAVSSGTEEEDAAFAILEEEEEDLDPFGFLRNRCGFMPDSSVGDLNGREFLLPTDTYENDNGAGDNTTVNCIGLPFVSISSPPPPTTNEDEAAASTATMLKVTIHTDEIGRYSILHADPESFDDDYSAAFTAVGYSWTAPSRGIYYCVSSGTNLTFNEYVQGATILVMVEVVPEDEVCESETMDAMESGSGNHDDDVAEQDHSILWDSRGYYLRADYFSYTVAGEETVYFQDSENARVVGSRNGDSLITIEVSWENDGQEKGFYALVQGSLTPPDERNEGEQNIRRSSWRMTEARVLNNDQEWVSFNLTIPGASEHLFGFRNECYQKESVVLSALDDDDNLHQIHFYNLTFMPFVPWYDDYSNQTAMDECKSKPVAQEPEMEYWMLDPYADTGERGSVNWMHPEFLLHADYFEWTIAGNEPQTMEDSMEIAMGVRVYSSGGANDLIMEANWTNRISRQGQAFRASFVSDGFFWYMSNATMIQNDELSETFENLTGVVQGTIGTCLNEDILVISNDRGGEIKFHNITLAVFLPWEDHQIQPEDSLPAVQSRSFAGVGENCGPFSLPISSNGETGVAEEEAVPAVADDYFANTTRSAERTGLEDGTVGKEGTALAVSSSAQKPRVAVTCIVGAIVTVLVSMKLQSL